MLNKNRIVCTWILLILSCMPNLVHAQEDGLGQTIQINTRLHSFTGKPSWLIVVRDVDHNQNIPYLFDIKRGKNFWLAFTYSRNYLIKISDLQFAPYREEPYRVKRIHNFCHLESNGHIIRGQSVVITITGELSPNTNSFRCHVAYFPTTNFTIVKPDTLP